MILKKSVFNLFEDVQRLGLLGINANEMQEARILLLPISQSAIYSCSIFEETLFGSGQSLSHRSLRVRSPLASPSDTEDEKKEEEKEEDEDKDKEEDEDKEEDDDKEEDEDEEKEEGEEKEESEGKEEDKEGDEDEYKDKEEDDQPRGRKSTRLSRSTPARARRIPLVLLQQTLDDEKFTIGSSPQSDVVLKSFKSGPETCWVNLQHCALYPNPDDSSVTLHNSSRCEFIIRMLKNEVQVQIVKPGSNLIIPEGTWYLNLGKGFDFQISILPHSKEWSDLHNALITSIEISTKPSYITNRGRLALPGDVRIKKSQVSSGLPVEDNNDTTGGTVVPAHMPMEPEPLRGGATDRTERQDKIISTLKWKNVALIDNRHVTLSSRRIDEESLGETYIDNRHITLSGRKVDDTHASRVVKRVVTDGTARAVKICRHPNPVVAAGLRAAEAKILETLDHNSIIRLFKADATHLTLELEYISGGSLDQHIDEQLMCTINPDAVQPIGLGISSGLEYIHARGIIHCDVKPGNILLNSSGAVLCDFGTAINIRAKPKDEPSGGTPCYIPPEAMYGKRSYSGDVLALGVTLLFVAKLTALPRENWIIRDIQTDPNAADMIYKWLLHVTKTTEKIPKHLKFICKMLEHDPEKRISARELVQDLEDGNWLRQSRLMKIA